MSHEEFMSRNALYSANPEKKTSNLKVGAVGDGSQSVARGLVSKCMFVDETIEEMQKVNEELEKQRASVDVSEGVMLDHVDPAMKDLAELDQDEVLAEMAKSAIKIAEQGLPEGFVRGKIVNNLSNYKSDSSRPTDYPLNENGAPQQVIAYEVAKMQETEEGFGIITKNKRFYPAETLQRAHQMFLTNPESCGDMSVVGEFPSLKEGELYQFTKQTKETWSIVGKGFEVPQIVRDMEPTLAVVPESKVETILEKINQGINSRSAYIPNGRYNEHELYVGEGISAKPVYDPKDPDRLTILQRYCGENVNRMFGSIVTDYTVTGTSTGKSRPLWFLQPARGNGRSLQEYKKFVEYMTGIRNNDEGIESFIKDITIHNLNVDCASPSYYGSYWRNLMHITDVKLSGNIQLMIATYQVKAGYKYPSVSRYPHTIKKVKLNITTKK